ncbi:GerMN domain-containing protein [Bacillus pinisoli]|uniref:GerMN domain-containing protein n=1 Tax=Bacillus pinisoli TaxID=2901866 RepID=UPI001FF186B5|nr:GerMN domain-containing protein [Bacillus pinisoli]
MKKSEWSDKQLEEFLQHMPHIKDRQSSDELYRKINARMQEEQVRKKTVKTWVLPSIAAVAAVLLIMVIGPSFLQYSGGSSEESASVEEANEEMTMIKEGESESTSIVGENSAASMDKSMEITVASPVLNQILTSADDNYVTIGVVDEQYMSVVPITFVLNDAATSRLELVEQALDQLPYENFGLGVTPLSNLDFEEVGDNKVEVIFPEGFVSKGFEDTAYFEGIIETLRWMGYTEAILKMKDGTQVELGKYGPRDTISLSMSTLKGYFASTSGNGATYLVPSNATYSSFGEALEGMKGNENHLQPTIPSNITIETSEIDNDSLLVTFSPESSINQEDSSHILMIKAILLTAKEFGYQDVTFENTPERMDGIELQVKNQPNPVQVPLAPNYINFNLTK